MKAPKYPFNEGDTYWTIKNNIAIKSCWDCESEKLYTNNNEYFETEKEALQTIKIIELYYLMSVMQNSFEKIAFSDEVNPRQEAKDILECIALIN